MNKDPHTHVAVVDLKYYYLGVVKKLSLVFYHHRDSVLTIEYEQKLR